MNNIKRKALPRAGLIYVVFMLNAVCVYMPLKRIKTAQDQRKLLQATTPLPDLNKCNQGRFSHYEIELSTDLSTGLSTFVRIKKR